MGVLLNEISSRFLTCSHSSLEDMSANSFPGNTTTGTSQMMVRNPLSSSLQLWQNNIIWLFVVVVFSIFCLLVVSLSAVSGLTIVSVCFLGITYLREYLHLPPEIVPSTLRRQARTETARPRPKGRLVGLNPVYTRVKQQFILRKCCHVLSLG